MAAAESYGEALSRVAEYVEAIGDEIEPKEHHFETARELVAKTIGEPSEETARKLRRNLIQEIAHPPAAYSLTEHEPYRVSGYDGSTR